MSGREYYWRMKNGEYINVDDMDRNHLRNVLKMIIRRNEELQKQSSTAKDFVLNGECAQMFNDDMEIADLQDEAGYVDNTF